MDGDRVGGRVHLFGIEALRAEVIPRIDPDASDLLQLVVGMQALLPEEIRRELNDGGHIIFTILVDEMTLLVELKQLGEEGIVGLHSYT